MTLLNYNLILKLRTKVVSWITDPKTYEVKQKEQSRYWIFFNFFIIYYYN